MHSKRDISGHCFTQSQCAGYESDPIRSVRSVTVSSPLVQMKPTTGRDGSRFGTVEHTKGAGPPRAVRMPLGLPVEPCGRLPGGPATSASHGPGTSGQAGTAGVLCMRRRELLAGCTKSPTPRGPARDATLVARAPHTCSAGHQLCAPSCDTVTGGLCAPKLSSSNRRSGAQRRDPPSSLFFFL